MLGFIELLGEIGELNDEQRDLLARMEANADTVLTLVANYLNLTQIENGKLTLQPPAGRRSPSWSSRWRRSTAARPSARTSRFAATIEEPPRLDRRRRRWPSSAC